MSIYQSMLPDRIVGASASSSPGTGWISVTNLSVLLTNARTANLPLFLLAGAYPSLQLDITTATGGGNPLTLNGVAGAVTIQLSGSAPYLFIGEWCQQCQYQKYRI
jgi:hypothetical protein